MPIQVKSVKMTTMDTVEFPDKDTTYTLIGNIAYMGDMKVSKTGVVWLSFVVIENHSHKDESGKWVDDGSLSYQVTVFGDQAEMCEEHLAKGDRVIVKGRMGDVREWDDKKGNKRVTGDVVADEVGLSLRFHPKAARKS